MAIFPAMIPRTMAGVLVSVCFQACPLMAEAPKVDRIFPPGGQRGKTVEVKVTGKLPEGTRIWSNRSDVKFEIQPKEGTLQAVVDPDATPGPAWLRFYNPEGATSLRPFLIGMLPETTEHEPNDRIDQAQTAAQNNVLINGALQKSGDVDIYAVPLEQGQTVILSLRANQRLGSPVDAVLQLTTDRGFVVAHNDDDHQVDPHITFTAAKQGTYFVRVFGFPTQPNSTIGFAGNANYLYRLLMTTGAYADHVVPLAGSLTPLSKVTLSGWNLGASTQTQPTLRTDQDGHLIVFHPQVANELRIPVTSHKLVLEHEDQAGSIQAIAVPSVVTGHIEPAGDVDTYQVSAAKGQKLNLRCEARAFDSLLDPVLKVIDAQGKTVKEADDQAKGRLDSHLNVTIPSDGDYRIEIHDRFQSGGRRHAYRLISETPLVDFTLKLAAGEFTLTSDKPLEIPVTITRSNGYAQEVDFVIEGLPDGVTAAPIKSMPKGDSSKAVKLKLVSTRTEPFQGTIHIVGRCLADADSEQRAARFTITTTAHSTSNIWLTVIKPADDAKQPLDKQPPAEEPKPKNSSRTPVSDRPPN